MIVYHMGIHQPRKYTRHPKTYRLENVVVIASALYLGALILKGIASYQDPNTTFLKQFTFGVNAPLVIAAEPKIAGVSGEMKDPTTENVVSEIARVFGPHGKAVVKQALDISMCESGWRAEAYNFNNNKTGDYNIFQVNSLWTKVFGDLYQHNWVENIRVAHEIYLRSNSFTAWVCAHKLSIVK